MKKFGKNLTNFFTENLKFYFKSTKSFILQLGITNAILIKWEVYPAYLA